MGSKVYDSHILLLNLNGRMSEARDKCETGDSNR